MSAELNVAELNVTEAPVSRRKPVSAPKGESSQDFERSASDSGQDSGGHSGGHDHGGQDHGGQDDGGPDSGGPDGGGDFDENGQRATHGLGQSKSSRRRRRKRKNKAAGGETAGAPNGAAASSDGAPIDPVMASILQSMPVLPGESLALANGNMHRQQERQQSGSQNGGSNGGQVRSMQAGGQAAVPAGGQSAAAQNGLAGDGTKRWKKKFRERQRGAAPMGQPQGASQGGGYPSSNGSGGGHSAGNGFRPQQQEFRGPDTHQPGNNAAGGGKRKGGFGQGGGGKQQRSGGGGRSFVGPMDHSYRAVNGNVFDSGGSNDAFLSNNGGGRSRGGYHSDAQPIDYSQGRAIPIAPDAPTRIYFFIEDLFFTAKISETARKLGVKIAFIKNEKEQIAALTSGEEEDRPGLIVFDLNNANAKPLTLIPKLKAKLKKQTSIVGFLSHLQGDLKAKAVEAGCDSVMPRAAFSQNLPNLLRRYGLEEVEEPNYNQ